MYYIGVDIGGTFTDLVLMDDSGDTRFYKTPTTPGDLKVGVFDALRLVAEDLGLTTRPEGQNSLPRGGAEDAGRAVRPLLSQVAHFGHGTTQITNALLQRKGVKTGLITTKGFADTIFIQRMMGLAAGLTDDEARHYSHRSLPVPIVPRNLVREVAERVDFAGAEVVPLSESGAVEAVRDLVGQGVEAIAVCFLWSFMNPKHEKQVQAIITREAPGVFVSISSELLPVMGEYERTSATVMNAYLAPITATYIKDLTGSLGQAGLKGKLCIMNSMGGVTTATEAAETAVHLLSSGPVGGVLGSISLGKALGIDNIVATDMGGTSFDVAVIADGKPTVAGLSEFSKYHISIPMVEVSSIGAGGGSIARVENGEVKVGPQSASARPGPVCYDRGGVFPTVTDADLILGIIDANYFLGGRIKLARDKAEQAIAEHIARPLGLNTVEAAAGIRRIVDSHMADLLRAYTLERGHDPRDFVVFAYGGAGPTHCASYAAELGAKQLIVPVTATVHSAYGALGADLKYTFEMTDLLRTPPYFQRASEHLDVDRVNRNFSALEERGIAALRRNGITDEKMVFKRTLCMLYRRQAHEIPVSIPWQRLGPPEIDELVGMFERAYEDLYGKGTAYKEAGIEIRRFRLDAIGLLPKPALRKHTAGKADPSAALLGERQVYFNEISGSARTKVYDGSRLAAGNVAGGPAVLQYPGTTVVIPPGQRALIDQYLNCIIEKS